MLVVAATMLTFLRSFQSFVYDQFDACIRLFFRCELLSNELIPSPRRFCFSSYRKFEVGELVGIANRIQKPNRLKP